MYIVKRNSTMGGFNVKRRGGAIHRLYNSTTTEGLGKAKTYDFYEKNNVSHPFKSLSGGNLKSFETVKLKNLKPKKYISLNI